MKNKTLLILTILIFSNISCQNESDLSNIKGIELFLIEDACRSKNSYNELKTIEERKSFIDSFNSSSDIPDEKCAFYIDLENCSLKTKPLLNKMDIEKFDWKLSEIHLTESGISKLEQLENISLIGKGFVIKLNGQNVYGGWLWNMVSSFGCDRTWAFQIPKEGLLKINFGLGGFKCGIDPRTDEKRIRKAIDS